MTYFRHSVRFLVCVVAFTLVGVLAADPGDGRADPVSPWRYTMVAFATPTPAAMDVYESDNGTDFTQIKKAAFRPASGRVRDPSIMRHTDGNYYVTYTTADGANIGFAKSVDRIRWEQLGNWPVPLCCAFLPGTGDGKGPVNPFGINGSAGFKDGPSLSPFVTKAWAPEWFVDGGRVHVIVSLSTGGGFVPYLLTALDSSLRRWSLPVPIAGIGADHIDTTVVKVGSTYHAFTKNETKKIVQHAVSKSVRGPYAFVAPGEWGSHVEGPAVTQLPDGTWRLYLDAYTKGEYLYSDSEDGLKTWTPPQELPELSGSVRHIGVMREAS